MRGGCTWKCVEAEGCVTIRSVSDVVERQLCTGCGACAYLESRRFRMADAVDFGRRPFLQANAAPETGEGLRACPGVSLTRPAPDQRPAADPTLYAEWGPVLEVWEGYAGDPEIRYAGSSGGAATALALFCLERKGWRQVLHTAASADRPYLNETVVSVDRDELLSRTGSRYAPASPVEGLARLEQGDGTGVFIGKPCDVAAVRKVQALRPALEQRLGLTIAFFCAGAPSTAGNLALLAREGVERPESVRELRFRGFGWPGLWRARFTDGDGRDREVSLSYEESWGFLQRYRQWRCYICPDHSGEFADLAVGDPWYRPTVPDEPGKSLIVVRSERGRRLLHEAAAAGYLVLEREDKSLLPRSQPNLRLTRGALWGRLLALRLFGAAVPSYHGFALFGAWLKGLTFKQKLQSVAGTVKRIYAKRLRSRVRLADSQV